MSLEIRIVKGKIELITGLHIGAGNDDIHIGGVDTQVVKDRDGMPYIPGSSLKGKIRSLLELSEGLIDAKQTGPVSSDAAPNSIIPKMFGDTVKYRSRLLFRDCFISEDSKKELLDKAIPATEAKVENAINRWEGKCISPRTIERVISGIKFDYEIVVRLFDGEDEKEIKDKLLFGMRMLQNDALGGSGSRGYGKIKFVESEWNKEKFEL